MRMVTATKAKPLVFPPVWRCIYCGSPETLSTEHIIPRGLRGNLVLPRSSCEPCRKITHKFETTCLRSNFWYFRIHTGMQRRLDERPKSLPMRARNKPMLVSPTNHPNLLLLPDFLVSVRKHVDSAESVVIQEGRLGWGAADVDQGEPGAV